MAFHTNSHSTDWLNDADVVRTQQTINKAHSAITKSEVKNKIIVDSTQGHTLHYNKHTSNAQTSNQHSMSSLTTSPSPTANTLHRLKHRQQDIVETRGVLELGEDLEFNTVVGLALVHDKYNSLTNTWIIDTGATMHLCNNKK